MMLALLSAVAGIAVPVYVNRLRRRELDERVNAKLKEAERKRRYAIEQENKELRMQLSLPPERRPHIAMVPEKPFPKSDVDFGQDGDRPLRLGGGPASPLLIAAGMIGMVMLLSQKKKKKATKPLEQTGKRELVEAFSKISGSRRIKELEAIKERLEQKANLDRKAGDLKSLKTRLEAKAELLERGRGVSDAVRRTGVDAFGGAVQEVDLEDS